MADLDNLARQHGFNVEAARVLQLAIRQGGGRQAQFSHPELGGMGQWSEGGMTQVGDMFNAGLRERVSALCAALADWSDAEVDVAAEAGPAPSQDWWPSGLGRPSAAGSQNGMRYACFPAERRVVIEQAGRVTVYDSGEHRIVGVSQSQGSGQTLVFSNQLGTVGADELPVAG